MPSKPNCVIHLIPWMINPSINFRKYQSILASRTRYIDRTRRGAIGCPMDIEDPAATLTELQVDPTRKRRCCDGCGRPWATCLCSAMPSSPLSLSGHVFVLRHPNEQKKNLATIPILMRCLKDITVVHGRRLHVSEGHSSTHCWGLSFMILLDIPISIPAGGNEP